MIPRTTSFNPRGGGAILKDEKPVSLSLEVEIVENRGRPGCQGSSSTSPLCTCPIQSLQQ